MRRHGNQVENIESVSIEKNVSIGDKKVKVELNTVHTGELDGQCIVLDEELLNNMVMQICNAIKGNCSKYIDIPDKIVIGKSKKQQTEDEKTESVDGEKILDSYESRFELEQIALNPDVKEKIRVAISAVKNQQKLVEEWGMSEYFGGKRAIILNFYGKAGTGKSMTAEAIAKALNKRVYRVNYAELESKYVGETPKNIKKAFECATKDNAVLIFDEADSFLGKRLSSVTQSADYGVNITRSVLLMELEKFSGIVVFTTNLIENYDEAFKRRILLSVYFDMPDKSAREQIWRLHLGNKMPLSKDTDANTLAGRYDKVSGADIKDMVFYAALYAVEHGKDEVDLVAFDYSHRVISERYENKEKDNVQIISHEVISEEEYQKELNGEGK